MRIAGTINPTKHGEQGRQQEDHDRRAPAIDPAGPTPASRTPGGRATITPGRGDGDDRVQQVPHGHTPNCCGISCFARNTDACRPEGPAGNRHYLLLHCPVERQPAAGLSRPLRCCRACRRCLPPAIHAVASFQNAPEPMAAGIMSAPSKRNTSEPFSSSAKP